MSSQSSEQLATTPQGSSGLSSAASGGSGARASSPEQGQAQPAAAAGAQPPQGSQGNGPQQQQGSIEDLLRSFIELSTARMDGLEKALDKLAGASRAPRSGRPQRASSRQQPRHPQGGDREDGDDLEDEEDGFSDDADSSYAPPKRRSARERAEPFERLEELFIPKGCSPSLGAVPPLYHTEAPRWYQLAEEMRSAQDVSTPRKNKWQHVTARQSVDFRVPGSFLKDLLKVINIMDGAAEAILKHFDQRKAYEVATWFLFLQNQYLRHCIGEFVRHEVTAGMLQNGQGLKAFDDIYKRGWDPKHPLPEGEVRREVTRLLERAQLGFYLGLLGGAEKRTGARNSGRNRNTQQRQTSSSTPATSSARSGGQRRSSPSSTTSTSGSGATAPSAGHQN